MRTERRNQEMWWQGMYIHAAVTTALGNMFRKKGEKPHTYLQQPVRVTPMTEEEKEAEAEKERQKAIAFFNNLAKKFADKQATNVPRATVPSANNELKDGE